MFIISGALVRTGAIDAVARTVVARARQHPRLAVVEVFGGALVASAFMNNTPVVVVLIPIGFVLGSCFAWLFLRLARVDPGARGPGTPFSFFRGGHKLDEALF